MEQYSRLEVGSRTSDVPEPSVISTDLDSFLNGVYRYYCEKGLHALVLRSVSNLVASLFTFLLSVLVLLLIDWGAVAACTSEESCKTVSLLYPNPLSPMTLYRFLVLCQLVPLGFYTVVLSSASCVAKVREALRVSDFYKRSLGVTDDALLTFLSWPEIVSRIIEFQDSSPTPLCIVQPTLSAIEITNIILRTDTMVLFVMKNMLPASAVAQSGVIRWCLQYGVVAWLFDERFRVRSDQLSTHLLKQRLKLLGWLSLILIGPMLIFSAILLVIKELDDVRAQRSSLTDREWTPLATSALRAFAEMPHFLQSRLAQAREFADQFSLPVVPQSTAPARMVKFTAGGLLAVLAVAGLVEDKSLIYLSVLGRNLFFHVALLSAVVTVASVVASETLSTVACKIRAGTDLTGFTYSLPRVGVVEVIVSTAPSPASQLLQKSVQLDLLSGEFRSRFFSFRFANFGTEFLALLAAPYFFLVLFPRTLAGPLMELVRKEVRSSENLGDFCNAGFFRRSHSVELESRGNLGSVVLALPFEIGLGLICFDRHFGSLFTPPVESENLLCLVKEFARRMAFLTNRPPDQTEFWYFVLFSLLSRTALLDDALFAQGEAVWTALLEERSHISNS